MTPSRDNSRRAARQLDALANRSSVKLYSHSPNDVLVQIALPLILILAITTRLTMLAYTMVSQQDSAPAVMELWQQQLIMRVDQALADWARAAHLADYPDTSTIAWAGPWPEDPVFQALCSKTGELNTPETLRSEILALALEAQQASTSATVGELLPSPAAQPDSKEAAYAATYIDQRLASWIDQIESLQWGTVARIAEGLPLGDQTGASDAAAQLRRITTELNTRGYPLLDSVQFEYGSETNSP